MWTLKLLPELLSFGASSQVLVGAGYEHTFLTWSPCTVHTGCSPHDFRLEEVGQVAMEPSF